LFADQAIFLDVEQVDNLQKIDDDQTNWQQHPPDGLAGFCGWS
jgi:hypothetical protein